MQDVRAVRTGALLFAGAWLGLGLAAATLFWLIQIPNRRITSGIINHGAQAFAVVERTDPSDHNTVYYRFMTDDGHTYHSADRADGPDGDAQTLHPGQLIQIWYDTRNPAISCDCVPKEAALGESVGSTLVGGALLGAIPACVFTLARLRKRGMTA